MLFYKKENHSNQDKKPRVPRGCYQGTSGIFHRHGVKVELEGYMIVNVTTRVELGQRINLVDAPQN